MNIKIKQSFVYRLIILGVRKKFNINKFYIRITGITLCNTHFEYGKNYENEISRYRI